MANTFTYMNATILSRKILEHATAALMPLTAFSTDFSADAVNPGTTIDSVLTNPFSTVNTKTVGVDYTVNDVTNNTVRITLASEPNYVSWMITDTQVAANGPVLNMDLFARQKAYGLTKSILVDVLGEITAAHYGASHNIGQPSAWGSDELADILPDMDNAGFDLSLCTLVTTPPYYWALLKTLANAASYGDSGPIQNGKIAALFGLRQIMSCPVLPANAESLVGFIAHPSAMAVAMRYLKPQDGNHYELANALTDSETGITLGQRQWYDDGKGAKIRVIEEIHGKKVCDYGDSDETTNGIIRLTSA